MTQAKGREQFKNFTGVSSYAKNLEIVDRLEMVVIETQKLQDNNTKQTEKIEMAIGGLSTELLLLQKDIKNLNSTISEANKKNDRMQIWFLVLTIIGVIFASSGIIQAWDIFARGIGK
jgi:hypothetical protein